MEGQDNWTECLVLFYFIFHAGISTSLSIYLSINIIETSLYLLTCCILFSLVNVCTRAVLETRAGDAVVEREVQEARIG